jgi:hypothetical protein
MPWQQYVADVAGEYDPDTGIPYYRQVGVTVPRQQGKTMLALCIQLNRCLSNRWAHPQRSAFTAQTGKAARDKWLEEIFPLMRDNEAMRRLIARRRSDNQLAINEGMANESVRFVTQSLIKLLSTSAGSGHGGTFHQAVMDEIWHDQDERREQSLRPNMLTVEDAQLLWCSTAGTQASTLLNRKVATGRRVATEDPGTGYAYFEWSAPDGWDPDDLDAYYSFMPALCPDPPCRCSDDWRHTVTMAVLQSERLDMDPWEYRRAYGNKPPQNSDMVWELGVWQRVCDKQAKPEGDVRFGLAVAEDRASAAIVAFDGTTFELVKHDQGVGWVVERCNELVAAHRGASIGIVTTSPAGNFIEKVDKVAEVSGTHELWACSTLYDRVRAGDVMFRADTKSTDPFTAAVEGVVKKQVGDRFCWSLKHSTSDVTPLVAATVALAADEPEAPPKSAIF